MKHITMTITALLAMLTMACPLTAFAEGEAAPAEAPAAEAPAEPDPVASQYKYKLDAEGNAELYDFVISDTFEGDLVIPAEIDGHRVDYVGNACYMEAKGIKSVTIPASLTDMGDSVFMGCTSLERFIVEEGNPYYSTTDDGVLVADNGAFLVAYPAAKLDETYTTPQGIDEIAPGAFSFAQNLKEINVTEGVIAIDNWAFAHSNIEKASIAGSVYQIDDYAFSYCESLHELNLGNGIEKIYHAAFAYDKALEQVTLPSTLTLIGQYAFCGTSLKCITIPDSLEEISYCAFGYDGSFNAIQDFTIYGEPNTMAQQYSKAADSENDYQNNFTFIAVEDASIPYELGGGKLYVETTEGETEPETDENGETVPTTEAVTQAYTADITEEIGSELYGNSRMKLILGIGGGVLVALAAVLIVVFAMKPKKQDNADASKENDNAE